MAKYRKLGKASAQRNALLRNQVTQLLYHGKIRTTEARAKEVVKIAEKLITLAVKEKDNYDEVTVTAKVAKKDKDGKRVYVTEILANNISFLDSKGTNTSSNDFNSLPEPPREDSVSSSNMNNMETVSVDKDPFEAFGDSIEISDNDLPF